MREASLTQCTLMSDPRLCLRYGGSTPAYMPGSTPTQETDGTMSKQRGILSKQKGSCIQWYSAATPVTS